MSHPLIEKWRQEAERDQRRGLKDVAAMGRHFADELDAYETERALEVLSVPVAAQESGVSQDTVRLAIKEGRVENAAEGGRMGIRRHDLPKLRKPRGRNRPFPELSSVDPDLVAKVEAAGGLRVS